MERERVAAYEDASAKLRSWQQAEVEGAKRSKREWYNLGSELMENADSNEELERAEYPLRRALEAEPTALDVLDNLGIVLSRQGKLKEAIEYFTQATDIAPDDERAQANLKSALKHRVNQLAALGGTSDGDPRSLYERTGEKIPGEDGVIRQRISIDELINGTGRGARFDQATRQQVLDSLVERKRAGTLEEIEVPSQREL